MKRFRSSDHEYLLDQSKVGLEIETCVYYTKYAEEYTFEMQRYETINEFFTHLKACLESKGLDIVGPYDDTEGYKNWKLDEDGSIRCPSNKEETSDVLEEGYIFAKDYRIVKDEDDKLAYAPIEIVTSVYEYSAIQKMLEDISSCLLTDNFAYGFNSSQGIHYNIGNSVLSEFTEDERYLAIERVLELMWYLEPLFVTYLPNYRQKEVEKKESYCKSLKLVFGTPDNMKNNWRKFYIKNEDEHQEVHSGYGEFVPKYTIVNLKNITEDSTKDVYFEFRLGSIHLNTDLLQAWLKMLTVLVVSGIDVNIYEQILGNRYLEDSFKYALFHFGGESMVEDTLGVIQGLPIRGSGPGTG